MSDSIQDHTTGAAGQANFADAAGDKGKGKAPEEHSMEDTSEDDEEDEGDVEEADEDNMEEIDTDNVLSSRTRNKDINWAEAAKDLPEDDEDDEDDDDFEEADEDHMEE